MSTKLLPCPFCGCRALVKVGETVMVSCSGCTATTFQTLRDPESAIRDWNHRADPPRLPVDEEGT